MYADQPIYIIVALWCLHRNTWVNRNDIARAFRLSERKASFQLSYLIKKSHIIDSDVRKVRSEHRSTTCYEVRVNSVSLPLVASRRYKPSRRTDGNRRHQGWQCVTGGQGVTETVVASKIREGKMMKPVFIYGDYRPDYRAVKVVIRHWYSDMELPCSIYF